tara:strand:- start:1833 stop:5459 length:3627 start_codon:yes stop_codon:yes gene_type:complete
MAGNRIVEKLKRPKLFSPSVSRQDMKYSVSRDVRLQEMASTNFESTSSFRYDDPGTGLKSTQEVPVNWSKFENHTFLNSAQSKVNIAFDRIVNEYPFDGSLKEVEGFEDSLTGYEKHVLDIFPKNNGFLLFSGTSVSENPAGGYDPQLGTHINVLDSAGAEFPDFSRKNDGASVIDFEQNPFSFEFLIRPPSEENHNAIICQKISGSKSVSVALSSSIAIGSCSIVFSINSGSSQLFASASVEKGKFSHVCATYDRDITNKVLIYVSESLVASSSSAFEFESLSFNRAKFIIGSGSAFSNPPGSLRESAVSTLTPTTTLSGALDEFRVFHSARTIEVQKESAKKSIFATPELKLYFKFNEPSGSFNSENVVLDSSGNSLHSKISNFLTNLRLTGSYSNPVSSENLERCPVLFPSYHDVSNLSTRLLSSASYYDSQNPDLITGLIPVHYLLEGQSAQGFKNQDGNIGSAVTATSIPGSAKIGSAQHLTAFLLIWAKFFDEIKIFIDHFSHLVHPSYDKYETVANKFLPFVANYYGINLPAIFPNADPTQYIDGENIDDSYARSVHSLSYIQAEIWKRILINLSEITRSKGTIYSIRSIIQAAGINPDNMLRIKEYGGPTRRSLSGIRETKAEVASSVDFSGSFAPVSPGTLTPTGFSTKFPHLFSPFLSGTRVEIGYPKIGGEYVSKTSANPHGISNDPSDGLFTSGSFTFESTYQFPGNRKYSSNQSAVRLHVSSSTTTITEGQAIANLLIISGTENSITSSGSTLRLYARPGLVSTDPLLRLQLTGVDIFDGNLWNVSFGRERFDQKPETNSTKYLSEQISTAGSSSYFLRCARQSHGEIKELYTTSAFFKESTGHNVFSKIDATYSPSGTFFVLGSQSMADFSTPGYSLFLNDPSLETRRGAKPGDFHDSRVTFFQGQASQMRFWSEALRSDVWQEHVRNFKSVGVEDPRVHFNFDTKPTGSFGRIRVDASIDQNITKSDSSGNIMFTDFSQNNLNVSGSGFEPNANAIRPETFYFSHLSPKFDVAQTDNKIRVRSYQSAELIERNPYATSAPSYEVLKSEQPDDDTRFTIEFSSVRALDEDIMNIFGNLEFFDNALGNTNLLFDDYYPNIEQIRKIYFDRLTGKPDYQLFFDLYKWFNTALGSLIEQMIPRKTKFLGINFVIESHVLERNRFRYLFDEIYLKALQRDTDRGNLLLSQIVGTMKKM